MATKFQYAINPLASASNNSFAVNQNTDWGAYCPETGERGQLEESTLHHFKHSMDHKMFDLQKIESIKKTMLLHEDIFQRQVKELHRLYNRQVKLMYELKKETTYKQGPSAGKVASSSQFSIWQKQGQDIRSKLPVHGLTYDSAERSASSCGESLRMPKGFTLERVAEEGPSTSTQPTEQDHQRPNSYGLSRSNKASMDGSGSDEEIDVELTLSIGCSKSKKRSNGQNNPCSLELGGSDSNYNGKELCSAAIIKKETREDSDDPSPALSSSSATLNQNTNATRSHWLFQDLSLNRT